MTIRRCSSGWKIKGWHDEHQSITAMKNAEFFLSIARGLMQCSVARMDCPKGLAIRVHIEEAERLLKEDIGEVDGDE